MLDLMPELGRVIDLIARRDRNLAEQLRRSASSVPLNFSEADWSQGGHRRSRIHTALGSLAETRTNLRVAVGWSYVDAEIVASLDAKLDRVAATGYRRLTAAR
jgi:four helix bundle protein